jgi:hypothetical protein
MTPTLPDPTHPPRSPRHAARWVGLATVWFAASGALATVLFNVVYSNVLPLVPAAAIAAGLVGGVLWWALVERGTATRLRGAVAGVLTGVFAHPVMWFVLLALEGMILPQYLGLSAITTGVGISLFFGFWGFVLAGWLTVILGCLGAVFLATVRMRDRD